VTDHPIRPEPVSSEPQPDAPAADVRFEMYRRESALPPPEELRGYYEIAENVGERILQMAEGAAAHRRKRDDHAHETNQKAIRASVVLVICVTLIILAVVAGAVWSAIAVSTAMGVALGLSPMGWIAVIVGLSRWRRRRPQSEDD